MTSIGRFVAIAILLAPPVAAADDAPTGRLEIGAGYRR
jgi:hypothetical protein